MCDPGPNLWQGETAEFARQRELGYRAAGGGSNPSDLYVSSPIGEGIDSVVNSYY